MRYNLGMKCHDCGTVLREYIREFDHQRELIHYSCPECESHWQLIHEYWKEYKDFKRIETPWK